MEILKSKLIQVSILSKKIKYFFIRPKSNKFLHEKVPYYSQWESKELVDDFIKGKTKVEDDPKWKKSGAKNKLEYLHWSWSGCGIACFQMIYSYLTKKKIPFVELGKNMMKYGGFKLDKLAYENGDYLHSLDGLYYEPFVNFLDQEFHLKGKIVSPMILDEVIQKLSLGNFIMASVSPYIRNPENNNFKQGKHLVLILGYNLKKQIFYLHNPSGIHKKSQEYAEISFRNFNKFFNHKGIIVQP